MGTRKVKIPEEVLENLYLNVEEAACCGLAQGTQINGKTTVDQLLALRYDAGGWNLNRKALIVTTIPEERAVYPRLRKAGFQEIAEFPSAHGFHRVKLWFALALQDNQVKLV